jgi:hypothetical protein
MGGLIIFFIVTLPAAPVQSLARRFAERKRSLRRACFDSGQGGCICGTMTPLTGAIRKIFLLAPVISIPTNCYAGAPDFTSL